MSEEPEAPAPVRRGPGRPRKADQPAPSAPLPLTLPEAPRIIKHRRSKNAAIEAELRSRFVLAENLVPRGLSVHGTCRTCRLAAANEELQHEINVRLIRGFPIPEVKAYAESQGFHVSLHSLTNHRDEHLLKYVTDGVVRHAEITAIAAAIGDSQDGNIAVVLGRFLSTIMLTAVAKLREEELAKLPPEKLINMATAVANAAGRVQSGDATTRLRELELQLKALRLDGAQRAQISAGVDAIRSEARDNPEVWAQLEPLLQQLADAAGADAPLPAAE